MSIVDDLLGKIGLKYEELRPIERETLNSMLAAIDKGGITPEKLKEYVKTMREAVENDLTKSDLGKKDDLFLKARLRNYLLLESFLISPEKAREQLEKAISNLIPKGVAK